MIKELQRNAALRDPTMAAAHLVGAQAAAMKDAANNQGGAAMAFMGMNMAQNAGGVNAQSLYQMGAQQQAQAAPAAPAADSWKCACGAVNTGNFCPQCGAKKPVTIRYKCDKCGWEPEEGATPPRFCPNCGDPFDSGDTV